MKAERLAEIREMVAALDEPYDQRIGSLASVRIALYAASNTRDMLACIDEQAATIQRMASEALHAGSNDLHQWEVIQRLTGERDRARDLAVRSGYFQSNEDDESAGGYQAQCGHDKRITTSGMDGKLWTYCDDCGKEVPSPTVDRPSAYDMPVGSVVKTADGSYSKLDDYAFGYNWGNDGGSDSIQSEWVESLFTRGLVTEWRVP